MGLRKNKFAEREGIEIVDNVFRRLYAYILPHKMRFVWAIVCGAIAGLLNGLLIFILKSVFTIILPGEKKESPTTFIPFDDAPVAFLREIEFARPQLAPDKEWIFVLIVCMSVPTILLIRALFSFLHEYLILWLNNKLLYKLRDDCFSSIMRQSLTFFNEKRQGELMHTVSQQTKMSAGTGIQFLGAIIKHPISIVSILIALLTIDWVYTVSAFTAFPLAILPVALIARKVRKSGAKEELEAEEMMVTMQESFDGIQVLKSHAREDYQRNRFNLGSRRLLEWLMRWRKAVEIATPLVETVASIGLSMGLIYAWRTGMEPGTFLVLNMGIASMYPHAKAIGRMHLQLQRCAVSASRVFGYIDKEPEMQDRENASELKDSKDAVIAIQDVSFAYQPDTPVLKDISLSFEPGKRYALVGRSGSGKSTILSLLLRFYDPNKGVITIGGEDIRNYTQASLREQFSLVSQDNFHFHDTIRANLLYGKLDATDAEIEAAAIAAHADEFIDQLPDGYDTVLGDKGKTLSGGQQQRLSIARAILRDTPILLLDEAMSALDTDSEKKVQEAVEKLSEGKTILAIAHRLSTVLNSDEIIVIKNGQVNSRGTHTELLESCSEYKKLYELQFKTSELRHPE